MSSFERALRWRRADGVYQLEELGDILRFIGPDGICIDLDRTAWREVHGALGLLLGSEKPKSQPKSLPENAGQPWTEILDEELRTFWRSNSSISAAAKHFKRTNGAIKARLERLGIAPSL